MKIFVKGTAALVFFVSVLFLITSCYDRYPYFLQEPEFDISFPEDGSAGYYLSLSTPDKECLIRYTINDREPSESYGTLYEEPLFLTSAASIAAVAYRVGYPSGPVSYFYYDPTNP